MTSKHWNVVLTIAGLILLATVVYLLINKPTETPLVKESNSTETAIPETKTPAESTNTEEKRLAREFIEENANGYLYTNNEFGYSLQFPKTWKGMQTTLTTRDMPPTILFALPTANCNGEPDIEIGNCFVYPLAISAFTKAEWDNVKNDAVHPTEVTRNEEYVFAYGQWQDAPDEWATINLNTNKVISSFELLK